MEPKQLGEYVSSVVNALAPLGSTVQSTGKQLFGYAVRHVYADAIENFVTLGASSLALYGMSRLYKKLYKNDPEYDNPVVWIPFGAASFVFGILFTIALFCSFSSINDLIAPEWAATQAVIELVKPK